MINTKIPLPPEMKAAIESATAAGAYVNVSHAERPVNTPYVCFSINKDTQFDLITGMLQPAHIIVGIHSNLADVVNRYLASHPNITREFDYPGIGEQECHGVTLIKYLN